MGPSTPQTWSAPPYPLTLPPEGVDVWRVNAEAFAADLLSLETLLDEGEKERAGRFVFQRDRRMFVLAHAALRSILSVYTNLPPHQITYQLNSYGKPGLPPGLSGPGMRFNLSHSGLIALVAVTALGEVGVDVEKVAPERAEIDIARRNFSSRECGDFLELTPPERVGAFFRCWTRKEAFIKGKGLGLSLELGLFDVTLSPGQKASLTASREDPADPLHWQIHDIPVGQGYAGALALRGTCHEIRLWDWTWNHIRDIVEDRHTR